jgi:LmbE family N-acetylglucosaminyl deacetylase
MAQTPAQQTPLRVIAFGAHPDDCDGKFGGTAAKFAKSGAAVKFVSVTNGDAGHQDMGGAALARRRYNETQESARRLGIAEYQVMNNHDGELMPTLEVRREVIRAIRGWKADIVLSPRPNDYHPDHRYTGVLVQDAAYMVVVPNIVSDVPALRKNPIFLYYDDNFQQPNPFRPDVAVNLDDVWSTKIDDLDAQVSQMYEWLPWVAGNLNRFPRIRWPANSGSRNRAGDGSPRPSGPRSWRATAPPRAERSNMPKRFSCANTAAGPASTNCGRCSPSRRRRRLSGKGRIQIWVTNDRPAATS